MAPRDPQRSLLPMMGEGGDQSTIGDYLRRSRILAAPDRMIQFLRFMGRPDHYGAFNDFLVFLQRPGVTRVATTIQWERLKRRVRRNARPLLILAPRSPVLFVYDVGDTTGPAPTREARLPSARRFTEDTLQLTMRNLAAMGVEVSLVHGDGPTTSRLVKGVWHSGDLFSPPKLVIEILHPRDAAHGYQLLIQEVAHPFLGHLGDEDGFGPDRRLIPEEVKALEADLVAYMACARAGLDQPGLGPMEAACVERADLLHLVDVHLMVRVLGMLERLAKK